MAQPLQIIVTGDSETDYFVLREENLASIIAKIPSDAKVSIVSVVGAFRTGKSFLLNFFLRYLRSQETDGTSNWMVNEGDELTEGNMNEGGWNLVEPEHASAKSVGSEISEGSTMKEVTASGKPALKKEASFAWRGGQERQTTGIWMWSEPFIRTTKASGGEKLAILLMDTQGMFDNETTMTLTAQIFGLSTLVSSFQIYNVDKRIQEDNLQHLALFSEYGRMALLPGKEDGKETKSGDSGKEDTCWSDVSSSKQEPAEADGTAAEKAGDEATSSAATTPAKPATTTSTATTTTKEVKPFQRLQFLVRDWQNFDTEYEETGETEEDKQVFSKVHQEMQKYLGDVIKTRGLNDLASTREQILRCFDKLDCYMLPHPGFSVTKKNYDGSISKIDPMFRALVNQYVRLLFDQELEAKLINGRKLGGRELQTYFQVYVKMFQAGQKSFPKAMTMLDATAEANNRNAYDGALLHYKSNMEKLAGQEQPYVKEVELQTMHDALYIQAFEQFDEIATMGAASVILKMRNQLKTVIEAERERFFHTNALRNPFRDVELYILPMGIAAVAWICSVIVNATCSTDFCEKTEDTFVNVYLFIFFGIVVLTWRHIAGALGYAKDILLPLIMQNTGGAGGGNAGTAAGAVATNLLNSIANKQKTT